VPTYDFVCSSCGHTAEDIEGMGGSKLRECPECGEKSYYRCLGRGGGISMGCVRDTYGTPIWHPGKPYFDKSLQRTFFNAKEKAEYLKANNLVMDGSENRSTTKDSESLIEGVDK
jgi:putative FmdB family regulatory protein